MRVTLDRKVAIRNVFSRYVVVRATKCPESDVERNGIWKRRHLLNENDTTSNFVSLFRFIPSHTSRIRNFSPRPSPGSQLWDYVLNRRWFLQCIPRGVTLSLGESRCPRKSGPGKPCLPWSNLLLHSWFPSGDYRSACFSGNSPPPAEDPFPQCIALKFR